MIDSVIASVSQGAVAMILSASALSKILHPATFRDSFASLVPGPPFRPMVVGAALAITELLIVGALVVVPQQGAVAAATLISVITLLIILAVGAKRSITCNCLGGGDHELGALDILRNIFVVILCLGSFFAGPVSYGVLEAIIILLSSALVTLLMVNFHGLAVVGRR